VLLEHPAVAQVVTFAVPDAKLGEDIAAAVVLRAPATELELRELVARRLAPYKVPRTIVFLDELPKGPTGKLQRIGLAERLGVGAVRSPAPAPAPPAGVRDVELELAVTALWKTVLNLGAVELQDNFFALGGDSILATQLLARAAQQFDVEISLPAFFETPTVAAQVVVISHHRRNQDDILSELETTSDAEAAELLAAARGGRATR
jgi:oxalate---CoA ligase